MTVSLATLLVQQTKEEIFAFALGVAQSVGLPTTTWQAGDPTRSLYLVESEFLSTLEGVVVGYIQSGFLDYATGTWLTVLAKQVYNVDRPDATFATTTENLSNAGGGVYDINPLDLTFKCTITGKTYHNTTGGHLGAGGTLSLEIEADEAGSASSAGAGEIDALVTTLLGVTCTNPTAAIGVDQLDEDTTRQQCRDKLGSFSPNGPKDAYSYVARNSALTGTTNITRVRVYPYSSTGNVQVYIATPSGAPLSGDVTLVSNAIANWCTPLCITPTVTGANAVIIPVTYTIYVYKSVNKTTAEVEADVLAALQSAFAKRPIGGDIVPPSATGYLYQSLIKGAIKGVYPDLVFRVEVSSPAGDTALANGDVPVLSAITPTVVFVNDP